MSIDLAIWLCAVALEVLLIGVILQRRIARLLPVFFVFSVWNLLSDLSARFVSARYGYSSPQFISFYLVEYSVDVAVQFAVLVELAWSVVRPYRASLPKPTVFVIAGFVLIVAAVVWPFTGTPGLHVDRQFSLLIRMQETSSTLRILFFLALAGMSQVLAIGWRSRELQVVTGLGIWSLASLAGWLIHMHHLSAMTFHRVDNAVAVISLGSMLYWIISFLQEEAPRQEFSPGMQKLLMTLAGSARVGRMTVDEVRKGRG